ncbi:MAG: hypothetical protein SCALA702_00620 [Melioribacteraceae bacterium]|nr:MAG: hypothetical protein SCALA702_00620 [Melioribacteraceae bacterium]
MPRNKIKLKKERMSFFINPELSERVSKLSRQTNQTVSEFARKALDEYSRQIELQKTEKELEEGYKANYQYYLNSQDEWKFADNE